MPDETLFAAILYVLVSGCAWRQLPSCVGIPPEHGFHALRHFYASEKLEAGESVVSLARWLGHSDPGVTLRKHSHFPPRAGARGSAAIDAIFA